MYVYSLLLILQYACAIDVDQQRAVDYPYNDNLYNDITPITIFSRQTKLSCSVYIQCFTVISIRPITILHLRQTQAQGGS